MRLRRWLVIPSITFLLAFMPVLLEAIPVWAQAPPGVLASIKSLKCRKEGPTVNLSFRIEGAFGPEARNTLESGLPVTFVHKLSVVQRRRFFFAKTLARRTIEASANLDTLTQQYTLTRAMDGVPLESSTTDRREDMERWLSEARNVVVSLPPASDYDSLVLRVKTEYRRDFLLWMFPWSLSAIGEKECR